MLEPSAPEHLGQAAPHAPGRGAESADEDPVRRDAGAEREKRAFQAWAAKRGHAEAGRALDRDWERMVTFYLVSTLIHRQNMLYESLSCA